MSENFPTQIAFLKVINHDTACLAFVGAKVAHDFYNILANSKPNSVFQKDFYSLKDHRFLCQIVDFRLNIDSEMMSGEKFKN